MRAPERQRRTHTDGEGAREGIATSLGNAIAMPVLPYSPNNANARLPGTIGLTNDLLAALLERLAEQAIVTGFTNVILMGDHGGGQPGVYQTVAKRLEGKYGPCGIHVYYGDEVYAKAQRDFDNWLAARGYPRSTHGGIPDTLMLMFLGGETWVRPNLVGTAVGDPVEARAQGRAGATRPVAPPLLNNGIVGDARRSSVELGKIAFEMKVDYAVAQIRRLLAGASNAAAPR